ncbi:histidine phosphatase superfamily [Syncephalis plumigaleata]|nr:histidine phosphatase superfamily [Syncephalis plumigaleata]
MTTTRNSIHSDTSTSTLSTSSAIMDSATPAPPPPLNVWVVRHGERYDHVDTHWALTPAGRRAPYDPPLTELGMLQARRTGDYLRSLPPAHQLSYSPVQPTRLPFLDIDSSTSLQSRYLILCSPFKRCIQTAQQIAIGLQASDSTLNQHRVALAIDPVLAEWHSEVYYDDPVPDTLISEAQQRHPHLFTGETSDLIADQLPVYSESLGQLRDRVRLTLDQLRMRASDGRLSRLYNQCIIDHHHHHNGKSSPFPLYPHGPRRIDLGLVPPIMTDTANTAWNVIIVTHGRWVLTAMEVGCGAPLLGYSVSYCAVCRLSRSMTLPVDTFGWQLTQMGSSQHLREHMI